MAFNLKNRHLLSLVHHSEREINYLLDLSRDLKCAKYAGTDIKMDGVEYRILSIKDALAIID